MVSWRKESGQASIPACGWANRGADRETIGGTKGKAIREDNRGGDRDGSNLNPKFEGWYPKFYLSNRNSLIMDDVPKSASNIYGLIETGTCPKSIGW